MNKIALLFSEISEYKGLIQCLLHASSFLWMVKHFKGI